MIEKRYNSKTGKMIDVTLCDCCHHEHENMIAESYSDFDGFMHISSKFHICPSCYEKNTFLNEYGFLFVKTRDKFSQEQVLYVTTRFSNFERVRNKSQIDRAFNPSYHEFLEWESK